METSIEKLVKLATHLMPPLTAAPTVPVSLAVVMELLMPENNAMTEIRLTMTDALAADLIVVTVLLTLVSNVTTELPTMTSTQTDAVPTA
jgi:hypothetical protein